MIPIVIGFPPAGGGNHLKNIVYSSLHKSSLPWYNTETVHTRAGTNFDIQELMQEHITCGHFAEIFSHREFIKSLPAIKFILLSPYTLQDRQLLGQRRKNLGYVDTYGPSVEYYDGEQVFLYEPFFYHECLGVPMHNIMNISISDFFKTNIHDELKQVARFIDCEIDVNQWIIRHGTWCNLNGLDQDDV